MTPWPSILDFKLEQELVTKAAVQGYAFGIECARSAINSRQWHDWSYWSDYSGWLPSRREGRDVYEAILNEAAQQAYELVRLGLQASLDAKAADRNAKADGTANAAGNAKAEEGKP